MPLVKTISFIVVPVGASALGPRGAEGSAEVESIEDIAKRIGEGLKRFRKDYDIGGGVEWHHTIAVVPVINSTASYEAWCRIQCVVSQVISEAVRSVSPEVADSLSIALPHVQCCSSDSGSRIDEYVLDLSIASAYSGYLTWADKVWEYWIKREYERTSGLGDIIGDIINKMDKIRRRGQENEDGDRGKDFGGIVNFPERQTQIAYLANLMAAYETGTTDARNIPEELLKFLAAYGYGRLLEDLIALFERINEPLYVCKRCPNGEDVDKFVNAGVYVVATSGQKFVSILTSLVASMYADVTFYYKYENAKWGLFLSVPPTQINTALMDEFRLVLDLVMEDVRAGTFVFLDDDDTKPVYRLIESLPPIFRNLFYKGCYIYTPALKALMDVYDRWRLRFIKHGYGWGMFRELQRIAAMLEVSGDPSWPWYELTLGLKDHFDRWALVWLGDIIPQTVEHRHLHSKRNMEQGMAFLAGIKEHLYKKMRFDQLFWFYYVFILAAFTHDLGHNFPGTKEYPYYYLKPNLVRNLHGYVSAWMLWKAWNAVKKAGGKPKIKGHVEDWAMLSFTFPFSTGEDGTGSEVFNRYLKGGELQSFYERFEWVIKAAMLIAIYHRQFAPVFSGSEGKPAKQRLDEFVKLLGEKEFCEFEKVMPVFGRMSSSGDCPPGYNIRLRALEDLLRSRVNVNIGVSTMFSALAGVRRKWSEFTRAIERHIGSIDNFLLLHTFFRLMDAFDVTWERAGSRDYIGIRMWMSSLQKDAVTALMDLVARSSLPSNMTWLYDALREQKEFLEGNYPHYAKHGWIKGIYPMWKEDGNRLKLVLKFLFRHPNNASVIYRERWKYFEYELGGMDIRQAVPEEVLDLAVGVKKELEDEFELFARAWNGIFRINPMYDRPEFLFGEESVDREDN